MVQLVEGRITFETDAEHPLTFDRLKDLHTRALMVGLPTDATITRISWHLRETPSAPYQVSVYWQVKPEGPYHRQPEEIPAPPLPSLTSNPFPNPLRTQE
jgi:hypothetical protein